MAAAVLKLMKFIISRFEDNLNLYSLQLTEGRMGYDIGGRMSQGGCDIWGWMSQGGVTWGAGCHRGRGDIESVKS